MPYYDILIEDDGEDDYYEDPFAEESDDLLLDLEEDRPRDCEE